MLQDLVELIRGTRFRISAQNTIAFSAGIDVLIFCGALLRGSQQPQESILLQLPHVPLSLFPETPISLNYGIKEYTLNHIRDPTII